MGHNHKGHKGRRTLRVVRQERKEGEGQRAFLTLCKKSLRGWCKVILSWHLSYFISDRVILDKIRSWVDNRLRVGIN